jgi:4-hydroxy-2-oxoheptanedioate aldolase
MRENKLKTLWQAGRTATNAWLTIPSAWTAEVMAHAGFDAVTLDMQHGLAGYETMLAMLQAVSTSETTPLARVPWNDPALTMRLLDGGAYGVICPMINNRLEAEAFVGACRYPPLGYRSYGPTRASVYAGEDYFKKANETVLTLAMIETAPGLENLDEILATPGLDGVYVGTIDLSISMGLAGLGDLDDPALKDAMNKIMAGIGKYGLVAGVHARNAAEARLLSEWGFRLITPATDTILLQTAARNVVKRNRELNS